MTIRKINGHEHAAVKVYEYEDGSCMLISYSTIVCEVDKNGWLTCNGLYSRTTIKHIGWFMREYGLNYYLAKFLYTDHAKYNMHTGEIIDRD